MNSCWPSSTRPGSPYWTMTSCPGWQTTRQRAVQGLGGFGTYDALMRESIAHPRMRYTWGPSRLTNLHQGGWQGEEAASDGGVCGAFLGRMCAGRRSALAGEKSFAY